ncbi:hypothetical protein CK203_049468 [Vitis vinifera]|uniref:Uncharacterized protein n=1 Tax=Vitis vinifera TaxID=29760 RepID=A0A438HAY1_VITVI|nr:hypothetical protein CK203_049468 [Vitis vinifera]
MDGDHLPYQVLAQEASGEHRSTVQNCLRNSPGRRYQRIWICPSGEVETLSFSIRRQNFGHEHPGGSARQPDINGGTHPGANGGSRVQLLSGYVVRMPSMVYPDALSGNQDTNASQAMSYLSIYEHLVEECLQFQLIGKCLEIKQMSLDNSSPTTMLHRKYLQTQIGGTIQISPGSQEHLSIQASSTSQQASSLEQAIVNLARGFPSQPHQNPKGIHEVETHEGESSQVRDVKALITLRSGKKVELPTPKPHVEKEEEKRQRREEIKGKKKDIVKERGP